MPIHDWTRLEPGDFHRTFVEKAADILNQGVNLLVVDLFPPRPATHTGSTRRSGTSSGMCRSRRRRASS